MHASKLEILYRKKGKVDTEEVVLQLFFRTKD